MKLFTKYNRISIGALFLVFIIGCIGFYFVLRYVLIMQLDETLRSEQTEITGYVKEHNQLPEIVNTNDQQTTFSPISAPFTKTTYASVKAWEEKDDEMDWMRQVTFGVTAGGQHYRAVVSKSQMETNDLLQLVILIVAGMVALVLLAEYCINRMVIRRLWSPFYSTLQQVEQYQLTQQEPMRFTTSNIDEFNLLNEGLGKMTDRAQHDYQVVKEFSANAAHEMQTPLAVIQTNTESLMQDEHILEQHNAAMQIIEQSVKRLSRLNKALLLLAKIENRQFITNETIQLDKIIKEKTGELAELATSKEITVHIQLSPVSVSFNQHLAEVMISNLLYNAIRYNIQGGQINIELTPQALTIANTSAIPALEKEKVSQRFYRHPQTQPDGNGLGLSIVKQVCDWAGYKLLYTYHNSMHIFSITLF